MDKDAATSFVASIPRGRWTSFAEVARAAGGSTAHAVGQWLTHRGNEVAYPWRVLSDNGDVPAGWRAANSGLRPDIPSTAADVRLRLRAEGVPLNLGGQARRTALYRYSDWDESAPEDAGQ